jgi:hypothetical protein
MRRTRFFLLLALPRASRCFELWVLLEALTDEQETL